jgi:hypothetical protein
MNSGLTGLPECHAYGSVVYSPARVLPVVRLGHREIETLGLSQGFWSDLCFSQKQHIDESALLR